MIQISSTCKNAMRCLYSKISLTEKQAVYIFALIYLYLFRCLIYNLFYKLPRSTLDLLDLGVEIKSNREI